MTAERLAELFYTSLVRRAPYFQLEQRCRDLAPWEEALEGVQRLLISASREVLMRMGEEDAQEVPYA